MRKIFESLDSITGIIVNRYLLEKIKPSREGLPRPLGSCYRDQSPLGVAPQRCPYAPLVLQIYIFILLSSKSFLRFFCDSIDI